jgi:rod shape-determining protein MreD
MIAAIVKGPLGRLVPVGVMLLALQTTLFVDVRPAGVVLQIMVAFAAAAGVAGGPERGMIAGFVLGLMLDLGTGSPLGSSSITMGLAGLVGGSVSYLNVDVHWWLAAVFVAFGSAAGELAVPLVRLFIGETEVFTTRLYTIVPVVAVAAAAISPLFVPMNRWCFRLGRAAWKIPAE